MKIIRQHQLTEDLLNKNNSGMAWKSMEKVWMANPEPTKVYSTFDAFNVVQKKDEMLFKIISNDTMYKGEVKDILWGNPINRENQLIGEPWVHMFYFTNINSIGKRDLWKNKEKLQFLRKFTNPGLPFKTGMWKLSREDFETITKNFN